MRDFAKISITDQSLSTDINNMIRLQSDLAGILQFNVTENDTDIVSFKDFKVMMGQEVRKHFSPLGI